MIVTITAEPQGVLKVEDLQGNPYGVRQTRLEGAFYGRAMGKGTLVGWAPDPEPGEILIDVDPALITPLASPDVSVAAKIMARENLRVTQGPLIEGQPWPLGHICARQ